MGMYYYSGSCINCVESVNWVNMVSTWSKNHHVHQDHRHETGDGTSGSMHPQDIQPCPKQLLLKENLIQWHTWFVIWWKNLYGTPQSASDTMLSQFCAQPNLTRFVSMLSFLLFLPGLPSTRLRNYH